MLKKVTKTEISVAPSRDVEGTRDSFEGWSNIGPVDLASKKCKLLGKLGYVSVNNPIFSDFTSQVLYKSYES